jgi:Ser/Thr protein kinase RdoA (MazF antagonist)
MTESVGAGTPMPPDGELLVERSRMHLSEVRRVGDVVVKDAHPWTATVHTVLAHLERRGFGAAPTVVGSGFDASGRETISFVPGQLLTKGEWSLAGAAAVGRLLRALHETMADYMPPADAQWRPWFGRALGEGPGVIGHCDVAPWNLVARAGLPVALIDWDLAGPVDPVVDLAQAVWLNAKLHDDIVAAREGLSSLASRAALGRALVDGYELPAAQRGRLIDLMIEFAMHSVANEADEAHLLPDTPVSELDRELPWAMAWRARAAVWMTRNRQALREALL